MTARRTAERLAGGPLGRVALIAVFLLVWEAGVRAGWISRFFFTSPTEILDVLGRWSAGGMLFSHLAVTITEAALGFVIGTMVGTALGLLFGFVPRLGAVMEPFMVLGNSFPRLTLAPLLIVWFGFGMAPKVILVTAIVLFICFFNTYKGFHEVDKELLARARLWGATKLQLAETIYLPATMSWIVAGLRASVGFAIVGAVIGEYVGGDEGIGYLIHQGQLRLRMREVFAGIVLLLVLGTLVDTALRMIERRFLAWRPESAAMGTAG